MSYKTVIIGDVIGFQVSDSKVIEIKDINSFKEFCLASPNNRDLLFDEIKNELNSIILEEINKFDSGERITLTKLLAYARIMQVVANSEIQIREEEEKARLDEESKQEFARIAEEWNFNV